MAAAAEACADLADRNRLAGRSSHQLDVFVEADQQEQAGRVEQVEHAVSQAGDLVVHVGSVGAGDHDHLVVNRQALGGSHQPVVQLALVRRERVVQEVAGEFERGPLLQQPGGGAYIAGRGPDVGERPGVFVDPGQEQGRLHRIELGGHLLERFDQERGGRPDFGDVGGPACLGIGSERVMVDHVDPRAFPDPLDRRKRLGVHQGHPLDRLAR